jgi:hypothetical protein
MILCVRADHARIRKSLQEALHTFRRADRRARRSDVAVAMIQPLTSLLAELSRHFASEQEDGGSLEEAVCCCPSISHQARELDEKRPQLLAELEALIRRFRDPSPRRRGTVEEQRMLEQFATRLHEHQAEKNRILSIAFGGTFGDDAI